MKNDVDIPKSQDGFVGPGISLITESLLHRRRMTYMKAIAQVTSAPS